MWIRFHNTLLNMKRYDTVGIGYNRPNGKPSYFVYLERRQGDEREYILEDAKQSEAEDLLEEIQSSLVDGCKVFSVDFWLSQRSPLNQ